MADSKITALTSIGASTDPANDPLVLVDVSDTSMAPSGTTKKVTVNQILGASGTATLASATITGDLTVDTSTLKVDSTNNRVGIGTASPAYLFDVLAAGASTVNDSFNVARFTGASAVANDFSLVGPATSQVRLNFSHPTASGNGEVGYDHSTNRMRFVAGGSEQHRIDPLGVFTWLDGAGGTRMTLNSTGLGVGGSPASKLSIFAGVDGDVGFFRGGSTRQLQIGTGATAGYLNTDNASKGFELRTNGVARAYFDNSGNVGIGVTPSAWGAGYKAIQIASSQSTALMGSGNQTELTTNAFFDSAWKYQGAGTVAASRYSQQSGVHYWYSAAAGAANATITDFATAKMTLDASGNLLVGTTSTSNTTQGFKILSTGRFYGVMATGGYAIMNHTGGSGTEYIYEFQRAGTAVGSITTTTTSTAYVTSSDYRLKETVQPLSGGLARVNALKPSIYKWKSDGSSGEGFLAHELAEVVPSAVTGEKDAVNEDGSIKAQGVDLSKVVPILVAAIKELTARVEALEA